MTRAKRPFYRLPVESNGAALQQARTVTGLDEEIALLRAALRRYASQEKPDDGLILASINTLARALLAQARIKGADPAEASKRLAEAIRQLGSCLVEDQR